MYLKKLAISLLFISAFLATGCATLTNDSHVPVTLSFSDNSSGTCTLSNKRMSIDVDVPGTAMVRRSDDILKIDCEGGSCDKDITI